MLPPQNALSPSPPPRGPPCSPQLPAMPTCLALTTSSEPCIHRLLPQWAQHHICCWPGPARPEEVVGQGGGGLAQGD